MKARGEITAWDYECETFEFTSIKRGSRFYTPDFKITNLDGSVEYHEVKGYMDQRSKTKLDRMHRHYPRIKVMLLEKPFFKSLNSQMRGLIHGWE